jgi:uncharacterized radical SAM superfamily Fe-S cluster-containing enzyme
MRPRVYIDTSVIGGCLDEEFADWSNLLFDEFRAGTKVAVVSDLTRMELEEAPQNVRDVLSSIPEEYVDDVFLDEEAFALADAYINDGVVGIRHLVDAQHIAVATVERVDVLVSWNFKQIVNLDRVHAFNAVNLKKGYPMLEIRSPREVVREKEG